MKQLTYICFLCTLCCICDAGVFYTNSWAIQLSGTTQSQTVNKIVEKYGFINLGKIFPEDYYHMVQRHVPNVSLQEHHLHNIRLQMIPEVLWFAQQTGKNRHQRNSFTALNDRLNSQQWYLSQAFDQNVVTAWAKGYTGKAVVVTILDDGLETSHPDLAGNYDPLASYDMNDNDPKPDVDYSQTNSRSHGTRCAGVVAAAANGTCGVGVAYQAKIGAVRMLDGTVTDLVEAKALNFNEQHIDIYSSSWGPEDSGSSVEGPGELAQQAFIRGISKGRGGLGSIYVWASGNGGIRLDNCNCDGYANSIYTVAVGSTTESGTVPFYSEPCSAILTTTYSGGSDLHRKIVTTDLHHSCTTEHTGTSASAPLAAGIIALALEANPALTWRDVQHLAVRASRHVHLRACDQRTNGVGRTVSHYYGYGLLDAGIMVDMASRWRAVKPQRRCTVDVTRRPIELRSKLKLKWDETACKGTRNWIRSLEHVQARLSLACSRRGDLSITLISPRGTVSQLLTQRPFDKSLSGFTDWAFMSVHCWDENPSGTWILQIENNGDSFNRGLLLKFQLELYGTDEPMTARSMEIVIEKCALRNSDGDCAECVHPLYVFESVCLVSCPPHYYESEGNGTGAFRRCMPCHTSCHSCSGKWSTDCLDCPPYSELDCHHGTCSKPMYPWERNRPKPYGKKRSMVLLGILMGVSLLTCVLVLAVIRPYMRRVGVINDVSSNNSEEPREVEIVDDSSSEEQAQTSSQHMS